MPRTSTTLQPNTPYREMGGAIAVTMRFVGTCVTSDGPSITAMQDAARDITRRTFLRYIDRGELAEIERTLCYDTGTERGGLRMSKDWHVSYHRSVYRGCPCVYFCHSRIEHIFCRGR